MRVRRLPSRDSCSRDREKRVGVRLRCHVACKPLLPATVTAMATPLDVNSLAGDSDSTSAQAEADADLLDIRARASLARPASPQVSRKTRMRVLHVGRAFHIVYSAAEANSVRELLHADLAPWVLEAGCRSCNSCMVFRHAVAHQDAADHFFPSVQPSATAPRCAVWEKWPLYCSAARLRQVPVAVPARPWLASSSAHNTTAWQGLPRRAQHLDA